MPVGDVSRRRPTRSQLAAHRTAIARARSLRRSRVRTRVIGGYIVAGYVRGAEMYCEAWPAGRYYTAATLTYLRALSRPCGGKARRNDVIARVEDEGARAFIARVCLRGLWRR